MTGILTGYKQVTAFSSDSEYETDSEECHYITLDLGVVDPTLLPSSSTYRLIGLDGPAPFLQLSGTVFKGKHEELLGTELLFTDGPSTTDEGDRSRRHVVHVANTEHRIRFREVELKAKPSAGKCGTPCEEKGGEDDDVGQVDMRFIEDNEGTRSVVWGQDTVHIKAKSSAHGANGREINKDNGRAGEMELDGEDAGESRGAGGEDLADDEMCVDPELRYDAMVTTDG